ncbi:hypothetical protein [Lentzea albidocapillata]|uniref:Sigma-70, region 4 n=1 Tax=Lentzea albidocapillata TaxID=40571 RepID=A0A1W2FT99_9PSEU|nr:hypothetical protein [Lentzea albidocapillata]SMD25197.1 hypothetical protein SAMN05660733_08037 [Lentzea albidocapillata]
MGRQYRNTLRAHAESLAVLGKAFTDLAARHRVAASSISRRTRSKLTAESDFADWIFRVAELSAAAERLLALEIELARSHGVTWAEVAEALGVSRQAAHDRFATHERWNRTRRISQLNQARWASMMRDYREKYGASENALLPFRRLRAGDPETTDRD